MMAFKELICKSLLYNAFRQGRYDFYEMIIYEIFL